MVDPGTDPAHRDPPPTPRWVKVMATVAIIAVLLIATVMLLGGGGDHGPGRHAAWTDAGGRTGAVPDQEAMRAQMTRS